MTQWRKLLRSLGFSESESNIYLLSLELGPSSVQDLAKKSKVSRVTAYAVIEQLMEQGLMSTVHKGKKSLYIAESPERLLSFVQGRVKNMEATLREVESSLNDLKLLQRGEKPVVRIFEGREGLKALQRDFLETRPKQADEFGNLDDIARLYTHEEMQPFYQEVRKIKPKMRSVFLANTLEPKANGPDSEMRVLPKNISGFSGDVWVYANKVALSTLGGKQIAVLIESEPLADTLRAMFDYIWSL